PTSMPLALPLLQQLQCRASGFVQSQLATSGRLQINAHRVLTTSPARVPRSFWASILLLEISRPSASKNVISCVSESLWPAADNLAVVLSLEAGRNSCRPWRGRLETASPRATNRTHPPGTPATE